jgi:zeaxanthin glucosyltransferase
VTNDQPGVAARLRHLGVAEVLPMGSLESAPLEQAVRRMMSNEGTRRRAREFATRLKEKDGPSHAADLVETGA